MIPFVHKKAPNIMCTTNKHRASIFVYVSIISKFDISSTVFVQNAADKAKKCPAFTQGLKFYIDL